MKTAKDNVKRAIYKIGNEKFLLLETSNSKQVRSRVYNYNFDKRTGFFQRWGKTLEDDPKFSPIGPEILDLEISINGCPIVGDGSSCKFCYKNNTNSDPTNMSLDTFKDIFKSFCIENDEGALITPLTQIAFGITGIQTNKHFVDMMKYSRNNGVIPNFTLSGVDLSDKIAKEVSQLVGGLAVSAYESDKNVCYNTVEKFTRLGVNQTNIHIVVSQETEDFVYEVLNDIKIDNRLKDLNSLVFLGVKPKGRAKGKFNHIGLDRYEKLISYCFEKDIPFGFDSCSCGFYEKTIREMKLSQRKKDQLIGMGESCCVTRLSSYVDVYGNYHPCSFMEKEQRWKNGISVIDKDFIKDVWYHDRTNELRFEQIETMMSNNDCARCPSFDSLNVDQ